MKELNEMTAIELLAVKVAAQKLTIISDEREALGTKITAEYKAKTEQIKSV